eukprot:gene103-biopygen19560
MHQNDGPCNGRMCDGQRSTVNAVLFTSLAGGWGGVEINPPPPAPPRGGVGCGCAPPSPAGQHAPLDLYGLGRPARSPRSSPPPDTRTVRAPRAPRTARAPRARGARRSGKGRGVAGAGAPRRGVLGGGTVKRPQYL